MLLLFFCPSGKRMFIPKNFEYSKSCSDDFLVVGKDFVLFEVEATGSNSTYPCNRGFKGPQFYFTTKTSSIPISVSFSFDFQLMSFFMAFPSIYFSSSMCVSLVVFYFLDFDFSCQFFLFEIGLILTFKMK